MTNRSFYTSVLAFAAAAALGANAKAEDAQIDATALMQEIHADLDSRNQQFTLALVERTNADVQYRAAKINNVFAPLTQPATFNYAVAAEDMKTTVAAAAVAKAEFEVSKKVANIENPFEPRLPMPPAMIAIDSENY